MSRTLKEKYGPWALVTGASTGIGRGFARQLAREGLDLVLVARSADKLKEVQQELQGKHGVQVRIAPIDLIGPDALSKIRAVTDNLNIGLLVNNAGSGVPGEFLDNDLDEELKVIDLNVRVPVELTHFFGRKFRDQSRGGIINVSSMVAFQGVPMFANYTGTKAFDLLFSESLERELKPYGIDVVALVPGPVTTDLTSTWNLSAFPTATRTPDQVARVALNAIGKKVVAIPGIDNRILAFTGRFAPRKLLATVMGKVVRRVLQPLQATGTKSGEAVLSKA